MQQLRPVSKRELVIFPIAVTVIVSLLLPSAAPLIGMLMFGNLLRVSGVTERLSKTAQNELMNIVTIFLGITVGATTKGSTFLTWDTIKILLLGVIAFMGWHRRRRAVGQSDVQTDRRQDQPAHRFRGRLRRADGGARLPEGSAAREPGNFLLMHAMGPNVAASSVRGGGGRVHRPVRLIPRPPVGLKTL